MAKYFSKEALLNEKEAISSINKHSYQLSGKVDLTPLFKKISNARIVMLGEASHGTHEFYTWRSYISRRLIEEKDFNFIAVEGDWPDCYRINRYIKNYKKAGETSKEVLQEFKRWPTWMRANWEIMELMDWLKQYNSTVPLNKKIGFYGLDVYSLWESMEAIMQYLGKVDPKALDIAKEAFECFEPYRKDEGRYYARASQFVPEVCEDEVMDLLQEIHQRLPRDDGDFENVFSTE